jgi:hypothetical protein
MALFAALVSALAPGMPDPIGIYPNNANIPAPLANTAVRVQTLFGGQQVTGSGVVFGARDIGNDRGALCVLTAAHVADAFPGQNVKRSVGFGNGAANLQFNGPNDYSVQQFVPGPTDVVSGVTRPVDLAMLGTVVKNFAAFQQQFPMQIAGLPTGFLPFTTTLDMAGYGDTFVVDPNRPNELLIFAQYGTLRVDTNTADRVVFPYTRTSANGKTYGMSVLEGDQDITLGANPAWPPTDAEAHPLRRDSGGPTWAEAPGTGGMPTYLLAGIHSDSQTAGTAQNSYIIVRQGHLWHDVNVSAYKSWITESCGTVLAVPEPSLVPLLFAAALALALARRR